MVEKMPDSVQRVAVKQLNANLQELRRAKGRIEFFLEYVITGRYDRALGKPERKKRVKLESIKPKKKNSKRGRKKKQKPKESLIQLIERVDAIKRKPPKRKMSRGEIFCSSDAWRQLSKRVIARYGAVCMKCSATNSICVDHIKPKSKYPELALNFDNLQVLCWPCNREKGNKDETDYR